MRTNSLATPTPLLIHTAVSANAVSKPPGGQPESSLGLVYIGLNIININFIYLGISHFNGSTKIKCSLQYIGFGGAQTATVIHSEIGAIPHVPKHLRAVSERMGNHYRPMSGGGGNVGAAREIFAPDTKPVRIGVGSISSKLRKSHNYFLCLKQFFQTRCFQQNSRKAFGEKPSYRHR